MRGQRAIDAVDDWIAHRPGTVVVVFLVLTGVFTLGLGGIETTSGQGDFLEDVPSWQTFQETNDKFFFSFGGPSRSTTVFQSGQNVLSKEGLLRALRVQDRLESHAGLKVTDTASPAVSVARQLDPGAETREAQIRAVERATPGEIDAAIRRAAETPGFTDGLSDDFNAGSASASMARLSVTHAGEVTGDRQDRVQRVLDGAEGEFDVYGPTPDLTSASLLLTLPAAFVFIVVFLIVAYRDLIDLLLGVVSIVVTMIWTFGFIGLMGMEFSILMVAVPPLLLAVGIDFGIHAVNRYREERERGRSITDSMRVTTDQLLVAFFIVTGTTVIGFLSNLVSLFSTVREFGIVAAIGIVFTFLIFGVFLPAAKVKADRLREGYPILTLSDTPLGSEGSLLGRLLSGGVVLAQRAPFLFLLAVALSGAWLGVYATGVDSGFGPEDFQAQEYDDLPGWMKSLPEPFAPPEYDSTEDFTVRKEKFGFQDEYQVWLYVETDMERDTALERIRQATRDRPPTLQGEGRRADAQSILSVIDSYAEQNPEFRRLVERNDHDDDGVPDDDLEEIYDALLSSPVRQQALSYMTADRRNAIVIFTTKAGTDNDRVTDEMYALADRQALDYRPTGSPIIFSEANGIIMDTVVSSLAITLVGASLFLIVIYWLTEGRPSLGVANVFPIALTVILVVASMRYVGVKFNSINGVILSLTIGLGIDYSVHVTHRFADEIERADVEVALDRTVRGTGGALTGSMLTTVSGIGVLVIALNPALSVFGLLTGMSILYAYLSSVVVLPSILVAWDRLLNRESGEALDPLAAARSAVLPATAGDRSTPDGQAAGDRSPPHERSARDGTSPGGQTADERHAGEGDATGDLSGSADGTEGPSDSADGTEDPSGPGDGSPGSDESGG